MSSTENTTHDSPRRRRSPLAVASVAAAVLVAGGGGAYFATAGLGSSGTTGAKSGAPGGDNDPPPLALDGYTESSGSRGDGSIAPGEPDPSGGGIVYKATGELPDGPDRAAVHRSSGTVTEAEVTRLAKALGLPGTPRSAGPVWKIGADKDGSAPLLQVDKEAPGTWTFARFGASPGGDNCLKGKSCPSGGDTPSGGSPDAAGPAVSEEAAKKAAAPVLDAVGHSDAELDAKQLMGAVRVVNADPVVGGLPTYGWTTGIQVGADGQVVGGSGRLKMPEKGDSYPVISAEKAVKQLNAAGAGQDRARIGGCATPVPAEGERQQDGELKPSAPCEPEGSGAGPEQVTIKKAVFGLAAHFVEGRQALVPSWLFEVAPKGVDQPFTITYPAVDPKFLTAPEPPEKDITPTKPPKDPVAPEEGLSPTSYDVSADGRTLTLTFWGGVCSDYAAKAAETEGQVRVSVVETNPDPKRVCIAMAKELKESVKLKQPLGDRKVVMAQTGESVPPLKR
ncbi:hypothetical protein [Streptomyces sp. NPDC002889]|uniref:hypothetical protein n=1 Tax=Streptomyces sp. NPDC002889 TaxID=3364669 RepID=UPI0036B43EC8